MFKRNFVIMTAAWAIFPTGANAALLNSNHNRHPSGFKPEVERDVARYHPHPRRYKKRHKSPRRGITIVL